MRVAARRCRARLRHRDRTRAPTWQAACIATPMRLVTVTVAAAFAIVFAGCASPHVHLRAAPDGSQRLDDRRAYYDAMKPAELRATHVGDQKPEPPPKIIMAGELQPS